MAGRGPQSFKKRQKEQQRKEKQQEKLAKRMERKRNPQAPEDDGEPDLNAPLAGGADGLLGETDGPLGEAELPLGGEPERP